MNTPPKSANEGWKKRFALGGLAIGFTVFVLELTAISDFGKEIVLASAIALIAGIVAGIFAAFGKRLYDIVMAFAATLLFH